MSNLIFVLIIFLVLIVLFLLTLFLYKTKKIKRVQGSYHKEDTKKYINIRLISLPPSFESLSNNTLRERSKELFEIFKLLDYKNKYEEYEKKSWHSWQISYLVAMYKRDLELFLPTCNDVFHEEILNDSLENLQISLKQIIEKYKKEVRVDKSKDILSKHLIWEGKEVERLMYYLYKYKNSSKDKS
jgi:predicted Holliday junction resolvase-like endonuclease